MKASRTTRILLVVIGVLLMVVFVIPPSVFNQFGGGGGTAGSVYGEEITVQDLADANQALQSITQLQISDGQQTQPLAMFLLGAGDQQLGSMVLNRLENDPALTYLLFAEAERRGITVPLTQVEETIQQAPVGVVAPVQGGGQRFTLLRDLPEGSLRQAGVAALQRLLTLLESFDRGQRYLKVSDPMTQAAIAQRTQDLDIRAIPFRAEDYYAQVETPTEAQLQEQFEAFKAVSGDEATEENPFAFGYRQPDRVKFQYLQIPAAELDRVVTGRFNSPRERELAYYNFYLENPGRFQPPATQPTTQATTQATATQPAATQPATRPTTGDPAVDAILADVPDDYLRVRDQVMEAYQRQQSGELAQQVERRLNSLLATDWRAYAAAVAAARGEEGQDLPADFEAPTTAVGVPITDPTYFSKVADLVRQQFGVQLNFRSLADRFYTIDELENEALVGPIARSLVPVPGTVLLFPEYIQSQAVPLQDESAEAPGTQDDPQQNEPTLDVYQPTPTLIDASSNDPLGQGGVFIARLIAAENDKPAESLDEVRQQVIDDVRQRLAFEQARQAAEQLAEQARGQELSAVADAGRVVDPEPFPLAGPPPTELNIGTQSQEQFRRETYDLLRPTEGDAQPVALIPLPADGVVWVAQLQDLTSLLPSADLQQQLANQFRQQLLLEMLQQTGRNPLAEWFEPEAIRTRTGYASPQ